MVGGLVTHNRAGEGREAAGDMVQSLAKQKSMHRSVIMHLAPCTTSQTPNIHLKHTGKCYSAQSS